GALEVMSLASDQRRRCAQCDIRNWTSDLTPEKCSPDVEFFPESSDARSSFAARQSLGSKFVVSLGQHVANPERTVQLVERRRSKRAITRYTDRNVLGQFVKQRHTRTERGLDSFGKLCHCDRRQRRQRPR